MTAKNTLENAKICMLTTAHSPKDDRIYYKESKTLVKSGVTVFYIFPKDSGPPPKDSDNLKFIPYDGSKMLKKRVQYFPEVSKYILRLIGSIKCDIVHAHEPDSLLIALKAKKKFNVKVVFDSHELWKGVIADKFFCGARFIEKLFEFGFDKKYLKLCDGGIGATWDISDYLKKYIDHQEVITLLNAPDVNIFGMESSQRKRNTNFVFCHDGYLTFERGLKVLAKAIKIVSQNHKFIFKIVGDVFGKEKVWLDNFIKKNRLEQVIYKTGWLKYEKVGKALEDCDAGLIAFTPKSNHIVAAPNKLFNYLMIGIPFIGPSFMKSLRKLKEEDNCGILVEEYTPRSFAEAMVWMIEHPDATRELGKNALRASINKYRWEHMELKLIKFYERILGV